MVHVNSIPAIEERTLGSAEVQLRDTIAPQPFPSKSRVKAEERSAKQLASGQVPVVKKVKSGKGAAGKTKKAAGAEPMAPAQVPVVKKVKAGKGPARKTKKAAGVKPRARSEHSRTAYQPAAVGPKLRGSGRRRQMESMESGGSTYRVLPTSPHCTAPLCNPRKWCKYPGPHPGFSARGMHSPTLCSSVHCRSERMHTWC